MRLDLVVSYIKKDAGEPKPSCSVPVIGCDVAQYAKLRGHAAGSQRDRYTVTSDLRSLLLICNCSPPTCDWKPAAKLLSLTHVQQVLGSILVRTPLIPQRFCLFRVRPSCTSWAVVRENWFLFRACLELPDCALGESRITVEVVGVNDFANAAQ